MKFMKKLSTILYRFVQTKFFTEFSYIAESPDLEAGPVLAPSVAAIQYLSSPQKNNSFMMKELFYLNLGGKPRRQVERVQSFPSHRCSSTLSANIKFVTLSIRHHRNTEKSWDKRFLFRAHEEPLRSQLHRHTLLLVRCPSILYSCRPPFLIL